MVKDWIPALWKKARIVLLLPLLFIIVLDVLVSEVRQEKEMPGMEIENEDVKLRSFTDATNKHIANSVASIKSC